MGNCSSDVKKNTPFIQLKYYRLDGINNTGGFMGKGRDEPFPCLISISSGDVPNCIWTHTVWFFKYILSEPKFTNYYPKRLIDTVPLNKEILITDLENHIDNEMTRAAIKFLLNIVQGDCVFYVRTLLHNKRQYLAIYPLYTWLNFYIRHKMTNFLNVYRDCANFLIQYKPFDSKFYNLVKVVKLLFKADPDLNSIEFHIKIWEREVIGIGLCDYNSQTANVNGIPTTLSNWVPRVGLIKYKGLEHINDQKTFPLIVETMIQYYANSLGAI